MCEAVLRRWRCDKENGVLQLVAAFVLALLLQPEDFGLVAIVMVPTSFAPLLVDFGSWKRYNTNEQSAQASFLATGVDEVLNSHQPRWPAGACAAQVIRAGRCHCQGAREASGSRAAGARDGEAH